MYKALTQFFQLRLLYIKAIPAGLETQWWSKISFLNECAINILKGFSPLLNLINTSVVESELLKYSVDRVVREKATHLWHSLWKVSSPKKKGEIFFSTCVSKLVSTNASSLAHTQWIGIAVKSNISCLLGTTSIPAGTWAFIHKT